MFEEGPSGASRDLWVLPFGGDPRPLVADPRFNERSAVFSPDGKWIAFVSDESGRPEIYLLPFPGPGRRSRFRQTGEAPWASRRAGWSCSTARGDALMTVPAAPTRSVRPRGSCYDLLARTGFTLYVTD